MYNTRTGMLKMSGEFRADFDADIKYMIDGDYSELLGSYPIKDVAGEGDAFTRATRLLKWMSANIKHKGDYDNHIDRHAKPLLDYSLGKEENGINCAALSEALTECLLAVGIKARAVYMMPCSPYDCDNHVVVEAYSDELGKWFMMDPTFNIYVTEDGVPQSVMEVRSLLAGRTALTFNDDAHYNGDEIDYDDTVSYYAKDMYWFTVSDIHGNTDEKRKTLVVAPLGFDAKLCTLANIAFRAESYGWQDGLISWREDVEKAKYFYVSDDVLK